MTSGGAPGSEQQPGLLAGAGLLIGLYAMAPGFYLAGLHVHKDAEVVDHVIPGLVILALVLVGIVWGSRSATTMLLAGLGVLLAGFWMTVTHVGLVAQAFRHQAPAGAATYHCSTALLALVLGLAWVWRYRGAGTVASEVGSRHGESSKP